MHSVTISEKNAPKFFSKFKCKCMPCQIFFFFFLKHFKCCSFKQWSNNFKLCFTSAISNTRAACGPPDAFERPANILKIDKSINFDQISLIFGKFSLFEGYSCKLLPAKVFSIKMRPADQFYLGMWPSEFETPALHVLVFRFSQILLKLD
jgi:hypothetical protein